MNLRTIQRYWQAIQIRVTDAEGRAEFFRKQGAQIGRGCSLLVNSLGSEPYLVSIGDDTVVAGEVAFITHDAGTWVFRKEHPRSGRFGRITVGSRVFVGHRATLMPGVTIGDRAIIGACSVVTKDVPSGTIVAGVPARVIGTVDDYMERTLADYPLLEPPPPGRPRSLAELRRQLEERYPRKDNRQ